MKRAAKLVLAFAAFTAACTTVGPNYSRPAPELPAGFAESVPGQPAIGADWWKLYGDPRLDEVVALALQRNADVKLAIARVEETDANLREAGAAFLPEIDLGAAGTRQKFSATQAIPLFAGFPAIRNNVRLTLSTQFEIDFWGRLRRGLEAAQGLALGSRYARDVVSLSVAGLTTQAYFSVRSLDAQIAFTRATVTSREQALDLARRRAAGGIASDLEVNQAQSALADATLQLRELQRQRALAEHQLGTLTGRVDIALPEGDLMQLPVPPLPPAGLPSDLLVRRPDIQQAEQQLIAANAQIGVARAAMLPSISLTGTLGEESRALSRLFERGSSIWTLGAGLNVPIFDWGRFQARTDAAQAREHQLVASYQRAIETGFREVADALTTSRRTAESEDDLQIRAQASRNALRLAQMRYEAGYSAFLEVLDAQRTLNDAELAVVRNRQTRLSASVDLMKALGGGWTP